MDKRHGNDKEDGRFLGRWRVRNGSYYYAFFFFGSLGDRDCVVLLRINSFLGMCRSLYRKSYGLAFSTFHQLVPSWFLNDILEYNIYVYTHT